jgi:hypothetical protein
MKYHVLLSISLKMTFYLCNQLKKEQNFFNLLAFGTFFIETLDFYYILHIQIILI